MMELTNAIYQSGADREIYEKLLIMLSPIAPHFCEELWQLLGHKTSILQERWPQSDPALLAQERITIIVQVNGKLRSKLEVPVGIAEAELKERALADEKLKPWIAGKPIKNFIVVPDKLVNIVL
jgi:leucyl-tRNA synthetase